MRPFRGSDGGDSDQLDLVWVDSVAGHLDSRELLYPLAVTHPHETLVRDAYRAFNKGDIDGFLVAFAEDAVLHGADGQIEGRDAIRSVVEQLRALTENTLHIEVHDVLANDNHTVILQLTKAKLGDRVLEDRVVYVCQGRDPARVTVQRVPASVLPPLSGHPGLL